LWCFFTNRIQKHDVRQIEQGIEIYSVQLKDVHKYIKQEAVNHSMNLAAFFLAREKIQI
jgi:hypothetical protein|tara:strand:+ start:127 stop:303 length:177 start_codon:yes stop_codon:yes gene_type:complete